MTSATVFLGRRVRLNHRPLTAQLWRRHNYRPLLSLSAPSCQLLRSQTCQFHHRRLFSTNNNNNNNKHNNSEQDEIREYLRRRRHDEKSEFNRRNSTTLWYLTSLAVLMVALAYGSVPLYQIFCQATGYGGTVQTKSKLHKLINYDDDDDDASEKNAKNKRERKITVEFTTDVDRQLPWEFTASQASMELRVGESALAFYKARNLSDKPIVGIATYNVNPMKAGLYFNKIQCFCFDEQRLQGNEEIDMPVFFFLDPDLLDDPRMDEVTNIMLSYTFFSSELNPDTMFDDDDDSSNSSSSKS